MNIGLGIVAAVVLGLVAFFAGEVIVYVAIAGIAIVPAVAILYFLGAMVREIFWPDRSVGKYIGYPY